MNGTVRPGEQIRPTSTGRFLGPLPEYGSMDPRRIKTYSDVRSTLESSILQPEFIEHKLPEIKPRSAAHAEQPKMPPTAQTTVPLFDAPADQSANTLKEAFVWEESKGIE